MSKQIVQLLSRVWESWFPPKENVFSSQLLHDRIPTRHNLFSRRIIFDPCGISCVFYNEPVESVCYIFVRCHFFRSGVVSCV